MQCVAMEAKVREESLLGHDMLPHDIPNESDLCGRNERGVVKVREDIFERLKSWGLFVLL